MPRRAQNIPLSIPKILQWSDLNHRRTDCWPKTNTGPVLGGPLGTTWRQIDNALRYGLRGLEGGSSLAQLLADHRAVRNVQALPPLTEQQIAAWARLHHQHAGDWLTENSGQVLDADGEDWRPSTWRCATDTAACLATTPWRSSLARLLGVRNQMDLPPLTEGGILAWMDRHHAETGNWPKCAGEAIAGTEGETWSAVDDALWKGLRGLPGRSSLAKLLADKRGVRNQADLPRLTPAAIRRWARLHRERTGKPPTVDSGPVVDAPGETWNGINQALWQGLRGLPGGSSLAKLLVRVPRQPT